VSDQFVRQTFRVELSGPFFERDPAKTVRGNIRDMLDEVAKLGEAQVRTLIEGHRGSMPYSKGWTAAHVRGRTRSLSGRRWQLSAVISADTSGMSKHDAIRTKAAASTIEARWHPFRSTKNDIARSRAILGANLTKGIE
jgi:hypothetical protein